MSWNYARDRYIRLFCNFLVGYGHVAQLVKHWVRLETVTRSNPDVVGTASFLYMKRIWLDLWKELAPNLTSVLDRVI